MKTLELKIDGMTCGHCVMSVQKALAAVPGVSVKNTGIGTALVSIDDAVAGDRALVDAVSDAGYTVTAIIEAAGG